MRPATRVVAIAGLSYTPIIAYLALLPVRDELPLGVALICAIAFLASCVVALVWGTFALVISYAETPPDRRKLFLAGAIVLFALPWLTTILVAASHR